ncbi:hypothetical protein GRI38_06750 [Altererythrobacter aurantiacus]|uniref:Lipoprotein n=1 Tax=Parapontixanthobacter aurantiacus TaxID=1463599 RepID=A0A844ZJ41_9SPHN|nr:hypothetical protein [Parapontixanthobacter aurantiacus]MXO85729.1 hypothetical protein [Parapontixanthobacter aurantiacus]
MVGVLKPQSALLICGCAMAAACRAQADTLPEAVDRTHIEAAVSLARADAGEQRLGDVRSYNVFLTSTDGMADTLEDFVIVLPQREPNSYRAAFYMAETDDDFRRVGKVVSFAGTRVPRLGNVGADGACLLAPKRDGSAQHYACVIDGKLTEGEMGAE